MPITLGEHRGAAAGTGSKDLMLEAYWQATGMEAKSTMKGMEAFTRILSFQFEINSPVDQQTAHASGRRQYKPFIIRKFTDQSTPLIFKALVSNEMVDEFKLVFYQAKPDGSGTVKQGQI